MKSKIVIIIISIAAILFIIYRLQFGDKIIDVNNIEAENIIVESESIKLYLALNNEKNQYVKHKYTISKNNIYVSIYARLFNSESGNHPVINIPLKTKDINKIILRDKNNKEITVWSK